MSRFGFVGRRLVSLVPLLLGIVLVVMLLLDLTPGDPARLVAGPRAGEAEVEAVRTQLGLDLPVWQRYLVYLGDILSGNLGTSFKTGQPVAGQIAAQLPVTLTVAVAATGLALVFAVVGAVGAARRPDGVIDHVVRGLGVLAIGLPSFWVAIMLIRLVALPTGWFPVAGLGSTPGEQVRAYILPALVVAISITPPMVRSLRGSLVELADAEFVLAGRTLGFRGAGLVRRFALRNALVPLVTVTAAQAGYALFGTVVVETAFGLPGMGQGLVTAASTRDFPLVQGYTLVFAVIVVALYLVSDVISALVDPRVRISA